MKRTSSFLKTTVKETYVREEISCFTLSKRDTQWECVQRITENIDIGATSVRAKSIKWTLVVIKEEILLRRKQRGRSFAFKIDNYPQKTELSKGLNGWCRGYFTYCKRYKGIKKHDDRFQPENPGWWNKN